MFWRYRKKYHSLKREYDDLKKKYNELLGWYRQLYDKYEKVLNFREIDRFYYDRSVALDYLKIHIRQNMHNIRNHNEIDDKYDTRKYVCLDGQRVRSKVEREIYNYLILNGVKVRYEAVLKLPKGGHFRPDFYLPEYKVYIEYYGKRPGEDKKYDIDRQFKKHYYDVLNIRLVEIEEEDSYDLYSNLKRKLSKYVDVSGWL